MPEILAVSSEIAHYRVVSKIGAGGMGDVYLAEDTRLHRKTALKILPPAFAGDSERMNRFIREARAASALNHPNIITIYEIGESDGTHFIATEYIEGETLHDRMRGLPLSLEATLDVAIQAGSALDAAHRAGIIHRDIKPENIMIRPDGILKVLDFGVAKVTDAIPETGEATIPGMVVGTANYMSPEQACGLGVDARSDVFSFGCVLYEMLCGRRAFQGEGPMKIISSVLRDEPEPLSALAPTLHPDVCGIVERALAKPADKRYQSIADLLVDLRELKRKLEHEGIERSLTPTAKEAATEIFAAPVGEPRTGLPPTNLSIELLPLIGREIEIAEIRSLLSRSDIRLVTITGVGGTGKTRISEAIARAALADFDDGVFWVDLASIDDPELLVPTIAQAVGVREESGRAIKDILLDYLATRRMLIVLDNFEQIAASAPLLADLLSASSDLKFVATSRVRLHLRFEREFTLSPLDIPSRNERRASALMGFPAVALFVERARAAKHDFELTDENAAAVAAICRRLDGLPLAIELAAARTKLLAPSAILSRLESSLKLLTGGSVDLPERQRTMRGTIAWSYDVLSDDEKKLLDRLAVFEGGFTFEAAEVVGDFDNDLSIDVLEGISSLVDHSLLSKREDADGEMRFRMLVVVREFALEQLEASGEARGVRRRHADFYARFGEDAFIGMEQVQAGRWLDVVEREHDNFRAALEWSLENSSETAVQIAGAIRPFWVRRGYITEASKWLRAALGRSSDEKDKTARSRACCSLGDVSWLMGDHASAEIYHGESLRLAREADEKYWASAALRGLGLAKKEQGDLASAKRLIAESLDVAREIDNRKQIALRLNSLGEIARTENDLEAARKFYEEALELSREESSHYHIPIVLINLAMVTFLLGDYDAVRPFATESLDFSEELANKISIGDALNVFGALAGKLGDFEKAARLFGAAQELYDSTGNQPEKLDREFNEKNISETRAAMGGGEFDAAFTTGRSLELSRALALARS